MASFQMIWEAWHSIYSHSTMRVVSRLAAQPNSLHDTTFQIPAISFVTVADALESCKKSKYSLGAIMIFPAVAKFCGTFSFIHVKFAGGLESAVTKNGMGSPSSSLIMVFCMSFTKIGRSKWKQLQRFGIQQGVSPLISPKLRNNEKQWFLEKEHPKIDYKM